VCSGTGNWRAGLAGSWGRAWARWGSLSRDRCGRVSGGRWLSHSGVVGRRGSGVVLGVGCGSGVHECRVRGTWRQSKGGSPCVNLGSLRHAGGARNVKTV
jgi:hypothetical protein